MIPTDIRRKAEAVWMGLSNQRADGSRADPVTDIARALLEERNRCMKIMSEQCDALEAACMQINQLR